MLKFDLLASESLQKPKLILGISRDHSYHRYPESSRLELQKRTMPNIAEGVTQQNPSEKSFSKATATSQTNEALGGSIIQSTMQNIYCCKCKRLLNQANVLYTVQCANCRHRRCNRCPVKEEKTPAMADLQEPQRESTTQGQKSQQWTYWQ